MLMDSTKPALDFIHQLPASYHAGHVLDKKTAAFLSDMIKRVFANRIVAENRGRFSKGLPPLTEEEILSRWEEAKQI